jgi:alpha-mannosidase
MFKHKIAEAIPMAKTTTPIPQLIPLRVNKALQELRGQLWTEHTPLAVEGGPVNEKFLSLAEAQRQTFTPVHPGEYFGPPHGGWMNRWFRFDLPQAEAAECGRRAVFWVSPGESTFYVNGEARGGCDAGHHYWLAPDEACQVWVDLGLYDAGLWGDMPAAAPDQYGLRFHGASLKLRNVEAWDAYYDLEVLSRLQNMMRQDIRHQVPSIGYCPPLEKCEPLLRKLLRGLDDALDAFDREGAKALSEALKGVYAAAKAEPYQIRCSLVGHAHIDLVWLWPESVTVRKGVHTFSSMLGLMDRYPEYVFTMSQPALLNAVKDDQPELYQRILAKIQDGRWEATGGLETEPDTNLPCGEALARSLLYGQRRFAEIRGGQISDCVWIPDVFGYANYLPQLFQLGGIKYFYTTKMTWSAITKFNHNAFVWKGSDGESEVLTYLHPAGYGGHVELSECVEAARSYRQADVHDEILFPMGYGDGGGGTTEEHVERSRRLADLAHAPRTSWSTAEAFFQRLDKVRDELPAYQGELYLEYHRGTYTTQGAYKAAYRGCERSLQTLEAVRAALSGKAPGQDAWLRLLFSQFHDALPGSSIALVYEQLEPELKALEKSQLAGSRQELAARAGQGQGAVSIFNPLPVTRPLVVELPAADFTGPSAQVGKALVPLQKSGSAVLAALPAVGALESVSIVPSATACETPDADPMAASPSQLTNGIVCAKFDAQGMLNALTVDGEELHLAGPARFTLHEDHPANFEEWDIDQSANWLEVDPGVILSLQVVENGPARVAVAAESKLGKDSKLRITYSLNAGERVLHIAASIEWREKRRLLRYLVPTEYRGRFARFGCGFGSALRPQLAGDQTDEAMWEVPGNRWAAALDDLGNGLALVTEAKYGFRCKEGNLSVSLLRSAVGHGTGDQGEHEVAWALGAFAARNQVGALCTAAEADALFTPPVVCEGALDLPAAFSFETLGSLVPSWVAPAESGKGVLLRLHEVSGGRGTAVLRLANRPNKACLVDLFENTLAELPLSADGTVQIAYKPYSVLGVLVAM